MARPLTLATVLKALPLAERVRRVLRSVRGAEVFLVGGAVRDLILKRPAGDVDVVVRGVPMTRLQTLLRRAGRVDLVGKTFGVLKFRPRGADDEIDVALPRTEHAFGTGGTRDVAVHSDHRLPIAEDLGRRDFTVNALALDLATGELVDLSGGLADLAAERLRTVGDPSARFHEDFSRLLRGLRFAVELGFAIEEATWRSLKRLMPQVGSEVVPRELVAKEFGTAFAADPVKAIDLWDVSGAFRAVLPEVLLMKGCQQPREFHSEGDVWTHARLAVEMSRSPAFRRVFREPPTLETTIAIFLHDLGKPLTRQTPEQHGTDRVRFSGHDVAGGRLAQAILSRLKISSYEGLVAPERVGWLITSHLIGLSARQMRPSTLERYFFVDRQRGNELRKLIWCDSVATIGADGTPALGAFRALERRLKSLKPKRTLPAPLIRGDELIRQLKIPSGPLVGRLLDGIRDGQLARRVVTRAQALALARRLLRTETR